jgi:histone acetyltransferase (RNA polymerase elongator complex component)
MNERIQQLEKQSYTEARHELGGTYMAFDKEKFAELIVKECMELVSATKDLAIEDGWNVDEAMSTAINDIEEHFGVEE